MLMMTPIVIGVSGLHGEGEMDWLVCCDQGGEEEEEGKGEWEKE